MEFGSRTIIDILQWLLASGAVFLVLRELFTGTAGWKAVEGFSVRKDEGPRKYWSVVAAHAFIAGALLYSAID